MHAIKLNEAKKKKKKKQKKTRVSGERNNH